MSFILACQGQDRSGHTQPRADPRESHGDLCVPWVVLLLLSTAPTGAAATFLGFVSAAAAFLAAFVDFLVVPVSVTSANKINQSTLLKAIHGVSKNISSTKGELRVQQVRFSPYGGMDESPFIQQLSIPLKISFRLVLREEQPALFICPFIESEKTFVGSWFAHSIFIRVQIMPRILVLRY